MNEFIIIALTIVLFSYCLWLIISFNKFFGPNIILKLPELERFPEKERRKIWLETISTVLLQWQTIIIVTLISLAVAFVYVKLEEMVQSQWNGALGIALIMCPLLLLRPLLIRRTRLTLSRREHKS